MVSLEIFIDNGPGVDLAYNRKEYQKYFLGIKVAGAYGWQPYHFHVPNVLKSGSLNLLESSGPVEACNGISLPLQQGITTVKWVDQPESLWNNPKIINLHSLPPESI